LTGENHLTVVAHEEDLADYFHQFAKSPQNMRVGLEAEFFGVSRSTGKALPYSGEEGIEAVLGALASLFDYQPLTEDGHIIGLSKRDIRISLEPGGQIELSAPPVRNIFQIEEQIKVFIAQLREVRPRFKNVAFLAVGIQPFSSLDEIPWVPKKRYGIMSEYFEGRGKLSHWMMKQTATNQINLDYASEEHAMQALRTALGISSIVSALFANSSFSEGGPNGFLSKRLQIWNNTDPSRTGLLTAFTRPDCTFRNYLDYILDMPMIFLIRNGEWIPAHHLTFRHFIRYGYQGMTATLGDFELHLSTAFPEARFKQYLELRGVDCQSPDLIPAVAAFWKGILYDDEALRRAWDLVDGVSESDRLALHHDVPRKGLHAELGGRPILPIARQLMEIACAGLGRQACGSGSGDECLFLKRIAAKIIFPEKSPAETLLEMWRSSLGKNPQRLIEYLQIG
jgi:glutamate--cysteine ligase